MKANCWFPRNRLLSHLRIATAATFISAAPAMALFAMLPMSSAHAETEELIIVYRITSADFIAEDQLVLKAEGQGHSKLFGAFTATATYTETFIPNACAQATGDVIISVGGDALYIQEDDTYCGGHVISGTWQVDGGTGQFLTASGSGTMAGRGTLGFNGRSVVRYTGALSF
jgi:hypothetical protein